MAIIFKPWEDLAIGDDYIFKRVMQQVAICKHFLEMLLGLAIREIRYLDTERSIKGGYRSKGVRLDVYVEDENNTVYNVEMQVRHLPLGIIGKRLRYYQSMLDASLLAAGAEYDQLNKSIIIFVCQFDPFGRGRDIYTFRNTCAEERDLLLGDEADKIFLNTRGTGDGLSDDLKAFVGYLNGKLSANPFVQEVHSLIEEIKAREEERMSYMTWEIQMREMLNEGRLEGRREGRAEGRAEAIARIVRNMLVIKMPYENIAASTEVSVEEVRRIAEESGLAY